MTLAQALKQKNRLAGELVRAQMVFQRENARRSDSASKVNRSEVWDTIVELSEQLGTLKGKITRANIGVYPLLERMAELKARIAFIQGLDKREGEDVQFVGRDQEKLAYTWDSHINQAKCDTMVGELQLQINTLQDEVDTYNATNCIE